MNRRRFSTIVIVLLLTILSASAQTNSPRQIYEQAEEEYNIGRIQIAKDMLKGCVHNLSSNFRLGGYRLLSLCCLALDEFEEARHYAELVLKENPYYTPTVEYPPRFIDLINEIKQGNIATITTASSQSESINEAPNPVTIITSEMIEELGYNKNLSQILAAYVPGMVEMLTNKMGESLATHGCYGNDQEMVLIMENGHRLNNRYDNNGQTSYAISTEKIDHIEVLRGPASSLYGNVALTAVVNIITKSGRSINGIKAKYGYGSFNTNKADLLIGTQFMDADIAAWASIYSSDGQKRHFDDGEGYLTDYKSYNFPLYQRDIRYFGKDVLYIGKYKDTPCYDFGVTLKLKGFNLMLTQKRNNKSNIAALYGGYDVSRYHPIEGFLPAYVTDETHASIGYTHQFKNWTIDASIYSDWYSYTDYSIDHDSIDVFDIVKGEVIPEEMERLSQGNFSYSNNREHSFGGLLKASTDYRFAGMKGNLLTGAQYDHFSFHSKNRFQGSNFEYIDGGYVNYTEMQNSGKESYLSFFIQDKHYFLPKLILNAGFRFDLRYRQDEDVLQNFSPRLALMYVPSELFSMKLSYSEAFSDLNFKNRYIYKSDSYSMDPQHISAVQLTAMGRIAPIHLNYEINLFYNNYSNLFALQVRRLLSDDGNPFQNDGCLENIGIEGSVNYAYKRLSAGLTFDYLHTLYSSAYYYNQTENKVNNVPLFTFHLHGAWKMIQSKNHELKLYANASYLGRMLVYQIDETDDYYTDSKFICDLGIKYAYRERFTLSVDVENILNTDYYLCGNRDDVYIPMFQRGRNVMGTISYAF